MSNSIDQAISACEKSRREYADEALKKPQGRDAFEFGRMCGVNQGLLMAQAHLTEIRVSDEGRELE